MESGVHVMSVQILTLVDLFQIRMVEHTKIVIMYRTSVTPVLILFIQHLLIPLI